MQTTIKNALVFLAICVAMAVTLIATMQPRFAGASAPPGLPAVMATTSLADVGPNIYSSTTPRTIIFAADGTCAARIITTVGQPIALGFGSRFNGTTTPSGVSGVTQAASTTVVYDSGQYGCGQVTAYGFSATTSITIIETQ